MIQYKIDFSDIESMDKLPEEFKNETLDLDILNNVSFFPQSMDWIILNLDTWLWKTVSSIILSILWFKFLWEISWETKWQIITTFSKNVYKTEVKKILDALDDYLKENNIIVWQNYEFKYTYFEFENEDEIKKTLPKTKTIEESNVKFNDEMFLEWKFDNVSTELQEIIVKAFEKDKDVSKSVKYLLDWLRVYLYDEANINI